VQSKNSLEYALVGAEWAVVQMRFCLRCRGRLAKRCTLYCPKMAYNLTPEKTFVKVSGSIFFRTGYYSTAAFD